METISIIGAGSMAAAIAGRIAKAGYKVELVSRDSAKATALADQLPGKATVGTYRAAPAGKIVVLAVPYSSAAAVVTDYGNALAGKVIIDITNPVAPTMDRLVTPSDSSGAQEIAKVAPSTAHVVKAFNTMFGHMLAKGGLLDAFIAADNAEAKASVAGVLERLGLRPLDVGGLRMAHALEAAGLLMVGLAQNGARSWNIALNVRIDQPESSHA